MRVRLLLTFLLVTVLGAASASAAPCSPTGFHGLTAALINPAVATGTIDATTCDIGVYFGPGARGTVEDAEIFGASLYGVAVIGDAGEVIVDVQDSWIHDVGLVGVYYRAYSPFGNASGRVDNTRFERYGKGGIVANGEGTQVAVTGNVVLGAGPTAAVAQNGIQIGYGASGTVMRNTVVGHSYTGPLYSSGGILVVGGAAYGTNPVTGEPMPLTTSTRIMNNLAVNNDVGVYLSNIDAGGNPPASATSIKVVNNTITNNAVTNGAVYQAGVSDQGNNDTIIANRITGAGYTQTSIPGVFVIDADPSFTNRPKVHANPDLLVGQH